MKLNFGGIARLACCVAAGGLLMLVGCAGFTEDSNTVQSAKRKRGLPCRSLRLGECVPDGLQG